MTQRLYSAKEDFEALIRINQLLHSPRNGIRWDFAYAEDHPTNSLFMIWPDFLDASGNSLPTDMPLPFGVDLKARMYILNREFAESFHRSRLQVGTKFFCHEGPKQVACGTVIQISRLMAT